MSQQVRGVVAWAKGEPVTPGAISLYAPDACSSAEPRATTPAPGLRQLRDPDNDDETDDGEDE